jgi:U3 small nucleolar RNA-associated protein 10
MQCIIPYHQTTLFSRFVQILNIDGTRWHFLEPIQRSGATLARETLVQRFHTDLTVLDFVCDAVQLYSRLEIDNKTFDNFFIASVLEYVEFSQVRENSLRRILPHVFWAYTSKNRDLRMGAYMITTLVSSKISLSVELIDVIIESLLAHVQKLSDTLIVLIFLFQAQRVAKLTPDQVNQLLNYMDFTNQIIRLSTKYRVENFVSAMMDSLVQNVIDGQDAESLELLVNEIDVKNMVEKITLRLFDNFTRDESVAENVKKVLKLLEKRYPNELDRALDVALTTFSEEQVLQFAELTLKRARHEVIEEANTTLYLALEHHDANIRILGLKKLRTMLGNHSEEVITFASDALLQRLSDDDPKVIEQVFEFPLASLVRASLLVPQLTKHFSQTKSKPLRGKIMLMLLDEDVLETTPVDQIIPFVLEFLQYDEKNASTLKAIWSRLSESSFKHPLLKGLPKFEKLVSEKNAFKILGENVRKQEQILLPLLLSIFQNGIAQQIILDILNEALPSVTVAHTMLKMVQTSVTFFVQTLERILKKTQVEELDMLEFMTSNVTYSTLIFEILLTIMSAPRFKEASQTTLPLLQTHLGNKTPLVLAMFYTAPSRYVNPTVRSRCLTIAAAFMSNPKIDYQQLLPALVSVFAIPPTNRGDDKRVAPAVLECISAILKNGFKGKLYKIDETIRKVESNVIKKFLEDILSNEKEILSDRSYFVTNTKLVDEITLLVAQSASVFVTAYGKYLHIKVLENKDTGVKVSAMHAVSEELTNKALSDGLSIDEATLYRELGRIYTSRTFDQLAEKEQEFDQLLRILSCHVELVSESGKFIPCTEMINSLDAKGLYIRLSMEQRFRFLSTVADVMQETRVSEVTTTLQKMLATFRVVGASLVQLLESTANTDRLVVVLEIITHVKGIYFIDVLVPKLFPILKRETRDYPLTMTLSTLQSVVEYMKTDKKIQSKHFDIDLIVKVLTVSKAPQVRNAATMLIGELASLYPEAMLKHINTVMKAVEDTIKQRDNFTFDVMEKAIHQIVPAIAQKDEKLVVSTFAGLYDYLPAEKRVKFYAGLVKALSRKRAFVFIIQFLSKYNRSRNTSIHNQSEVDSNKEAMLEFCHSLMDQLSAMKQLTGGIELVKAARVIYEGSREYSAENKKLLAESLIDFVTHHLSSMVFLKRLVMYEQNNKETAQRMLMTMAYLAIRFEEVKESTQALFKKILQLLAPESFVTVVQHLVVGQGATLTVQRKALETLNNHLVSPSAIESIEQNHKLYLETIVPILEVVLERTNDPILKQSSIVAVELISRKLGKAHAEDLSSLLPVVLGTLATKDERIIGSACLALATMCAEFGLHALEHINQVVKALLIVLRASLSRQEVDEDRSTNVLRIAALSSLDLIVRSHANFVTPFMNDIILVLVNCAVDIQQNKRLSGKASALLSYLAQQVEARHILQPLLGAYHECIVMLRDREPSLISTCMTSLLLVIGEAIDALDATMIETHYQRVVDFLQTALDIRRVHGETLLGSSATAINRIEDAVIQVAKKLTLKLNENLFKPVLMSIVDWAREEKSFERLLVLYKLLFMWTDLLKSIFVPYYATLLENIASDLNSIRFGNSEIEEEDDEDEDDEQVGQKRKRAPVEQFNDEQDDLQIKYDVIIAIATTLQSCFENDSDGLMEVHTRFDTIVQPLVDQLDNNGDGRVIERSSAIASCLGQLAVVVPQVQWKQLQYQVLTKTQDQDRDVKCAAVATLYQFYEKVGQSFVINLPEMIPYIAELLEDENKAVVLATQKLVAKIENVTGEDFAQYLK